MVSAAASSAASAQLFRQAEGLKANISGKFAETTDHFSEEFVKRKNLQDIYKTILLSDLQYALDRKVELELWNNAFKGHIDYLRQQLKEKRGSDKAELQAKLWFFIDASIGFYLQLLHEFCDSYDIELPFRTKAINLGILSEYDPVVQEKPKKNSCYYVCQDCLVHLGDLARYRNEIAQAEAYYRLASDIVAVNGQPYNQLAIIASSKGDQVKAIFYYCKSVLVQNPFPAAISNLQKTLATVCSKPSISILEKSNCLSMEEVITLFLQYHGYVYLMQNLGKLSTLQKKIISDFQLVAEEFTCDQLLHLTVLNIFTLYKNKPKEEGEQEECIAEDELEVWNQVTSLSVAFYRCLVFLAVELYNTEDDVENNKFLPSVKIFSDWVLCSGSSVLLEKAFNRDVELYPKLAELGNELLKRTGPISTPTVTPLPEDRHVQGFFPLRRLHRKLDFKHADENADAVSSLRAYRVISFVNWLCQQEPASKYIGKGESGGEARFICLKYSSSGNTETASETLKMSEKDFDMAVKKLFDTLPDLQTKDRLLRSKSPFRETRSLFRTDSEEQGIKEIQPVSGPVASYSLFDSTWTVPFQRSPTKELPSEETSYPEVFEKLTAPMTKDDNKKTHPTNESNSVQPDVFPKASRAMNIGIFPSSTSVPRQQPRPAHPKREVTAKPLSPMANPIPNHPIQQQLSRMPVNLQPPASFYNNSQSAAVAQSRMQFPSHVGGQVALNGLKQSAFNNQHNINQQPLPFVAPNQTVSYPVQQNIHQPANFPGFMQPLVPNGAVFGAIGQTPRSQNQNCAQMNMTPPGSPAMHRNANKPSQSIWSSNYGFGQGALSALEQLLKEQKQSQRPSQSNQ